MQGPVIVRTFSAEVHFKSQGVITNNTVITRRKMIEIMLDGIVLRNSRGEVALYSDAYPSAPWLIQRYPGGDWEPMIPTDWHESWREFKPMTKLGTPPQIPMSRLQYLDKLRDLGNTPRWFVRVKGDVSPGAPWRLPHTVCDSDPKYVEHAKLDINTGEIVAGPFDFSIEVSDEF